MLTSRFVCAIRLARETRPLHPTKPRHFGVPLRATIPPPTPRPCARIVMAAHPGLFPSATFSGAGDLESRRFARANDARIRR